MRQKTIKILSAVILAACQWVSAQGQAYRCAADTAEVSTILGRLAAPGEPSHTRAAAAALELVGKPWMERLKADTLSAPQVNLEGFDDMTFLNAVTALAKTSVAPQPRWRDYVSNLVNVGYRRGEAGDFGSRLLYGAQWVVDNSYRGNVRELTESGSDAVFKTKSLDYITRHRDQYAALADSAMYEKVRFAEMGYRLHKIPHMRPEWSKSKDVQEQMADGDIIMVMSREPDIDTWTIGVVVMREDGPHLVHASREAGGVVEEPLPLHRYLKQQAKNIYGFRWLRLKDY